MATSPSTGAWDALLQQHPEANILQTTAWGQFKARHGWRSETLVGDDGGCLILFRTPLPGLRIAYVPRGPVGNWPPLVPELIRLSRRRGALALILEPDLEDPHAAGLTRQGFVPGRRTIQPRSTLIVDLRGSEDEVLARMHQKTRYNIGLARRRGVTVRPWPEPETFAAMLRRTGDRQGFGVHTPAYYRDAYETFHSRGECEILVAEVEGEAAAALMVFAKGHGAWYFYGASTDRHRDRMPSYLLQWEAMRWSRARGATGYDLWGIPDVPAEELEAGFQTRSDGLWGVYRFKRGFGGRLARTSGAWEFPLRPAAYRLYRLLGSRHAG